MRRVFERVAVVKNEVGDFTGVEAAKLGVDVEDAGRLERDAGVNVEMPRFMSEIVEEVVRLARSSPHVSQASGVSVRTSIANAETVVSNAERRGIVTGEKRVVTRICDLNYLIASCRGKIEMTLAEEEGAEDKLIRSITGGLTVRASCCHLTSILSRS